MQYGNFIEADQKIIAQQTNLSIASVKRSIKELIKCNLLVCTPDMNDKRRNTYYINPHIAWKGNTGDRIRFIDEMKINPPLAVKQTEIAFLDLLKENHDKTL